MARNPVEGGELEMMKYMQCKCCGRELPLTSFEQFKTGTYRKMCWQCRWVLNGKGVRKRKLLKVADTPSN